MSSAAFGQSIPGGQYVVTVGLMLFAFATLIAWYYYGEKCVEYLFRARRGGRVAIRIYQVAYVAMVFAGCVANLDAVWEFADCFNGLMGDSEPDRAHRALARDQATLAGFLPRSRPSAPAQHGLPRPADVPRQVIESRRLRWARRL